MAVHTAIEVFLNLQIRPVCENDVESLVQLSLLAWIPIFESFEQILGKDIYSLIWPAWKISQREAVERVCKESEKFSVLVAELDGIVTGFLAYELNQKANTGEVQLLAVHPEFQNRGIGTELNNVALKKMQENGIELAIVETAGDPSHAPARRSYEKAGYTALPIVRYLKKFNWKLVELCEKTLPNCLLFMPPGTAGIIQYTSPALFENAPRRTALGALISANYFV